MEHNENKSFKFTYSASEQEEIKNIRKKYIPPKEDKMQILRKLDDSVYKKPSVYSLVLGIVGALIMGVGMCCCMVWQGVFFIPGIIVGVAGIILICLAYPIYKKVLEKERERIAPEILRLTDELMK